MAKLGQISTTPDGSEFILTGKGWVPNTPELEGAAGAGVFGAAMSNAIELASFGFIEQPEEFQQVSPVASRAADVVSAVGLMSPLLRGALGAAKGLGVASRGAAKQATKAEGGTAFRTPSGFVKRPSDVVPESLQGTARAIESGFQAFPGLRVITDVINNQKSKIMGTKVGRALGLTDDEIRASGGKLRPSDVEPALNRIDDTYNAARDAASAKVTTPQVAKLADEAADAGFITKQEVGTLTRATDETGAQLLDLRSSLREVMRTSTSRLERQRAAEIIDSIQELIKDATKGTELFAELGIADRQYKLWKALDKAGTVSGEGKLNLASLKNSLSSKKSFGGRVGRGGKREGLREVEKEMFDAIDELGPINFQIPSSGTAERAIAASLLGGAIGIPVLGGT